MQKFTFRAFALALAALPFLGWGGNVLGSEPEKDVAKAVANLQTWLWESSYAKTWNTYLLTDQLKAELSRPDKADPQQLAAILARYESGASGLDKSRFVAVRDALKKWVEARSQATLPARDELAGLAENIKMGAKSDADVDRAQAQLRTAIGQLGQFLDSQGRRGRDWRRYVQWEKLVALGKAKQPNEKEVAAALARFEADEDGLEMPQYIAVRNALRNYLYLSQARNLGNVAKSLLQRVEPLPAEPRFQALLKNHGPESRHLEAVKIGAYIGELEKFHQAPTLVRAVRHHLSHPNLTGYISADFVSAALGEKLNEDIKVNEVILGTSVNGTGHLVGQVTASLTADDAKGVITMAMAGTTKTKTTGHNGPVTIYSQGVTTLEGKTSIVMTPEGVTHPPATGKAVTKTNVTGVGTRRNGPMGKMIQRKAWEKIGESKSEAERVASRKAAARLEERMDRQADQSLKKANHDYAYKFRDPMIRHDAFPPVMKLRTTPTAIELMMQQATASQLAAPVPPQDLTQNHDMAVRLHESLLNNFAATRIGGKTITEKSASESGASPEQTEKMKKELNKQKDRNRAELFAKMSEDEKKEELKRRAHADKEQKFSVKMAELNPVTVELRDGTAKVTIRGTEFEGIDGQTYTDHMSIWAVYSIELAPNGGLSLVMKDRTQNKGWGVMSTVAEYGGKDQSDLRLRGKLSARFKDIFTDLYRIELEPLLLPGKLERAGRLAYKQADAEKGWLTLAWDRLEKKAPKVTTREAGAVKR